MGSRVGDSLLVKYAVASAGAKPGKQGRGGGVAVVTKHEVKPEEEAEEEEEDQKGYFGVGQDAYALPSSSSRVTSGENSTVSAVASGVTVKQEETEGEASGGGGGGGVVGLGVNPAGDGSRGAVSSGDTAAEEIAVATGAVDGGEGAVVDDRSAGAEVDAAAPTSEASSGSKAAVEEGTETAAEAGEGVGRSYCSAPPVGVEGDGETLSVATPTKAPKGATSSSQDRKGEEEVRGEESVKDEDMVEAVSGGAGGGGSAKRGRGEWSSSDDEGGGRVVFDEEAQPNKKRPRAATSTSSSTAAAAAAAAAAAGESDAAPSSTAAAAAALSTGVDVTAAARAETGFVAAVGEEQGGHREVTPVLSPERNDPATAVSAMDTTSSSSSLHEASAGAAVADARVATAGVVTTAGAADGSAEGEGAASAAAAAATRAKGAADHNQNAPTITAIALSREEQESIQEEEELYGARLGPSPTSTGRTDGGLGGGSLALLGPKDGDRTIEAVGFRLRVVDSICTLGPIVDAALVPSAYHVPKTAALTGGRGGGGGGSGNRGRFRGQRAVKGSEQTRAAAVAAAATVGGRGGAGGGTSGGGIRTSLVCAAGYGGQGSLAVFSAGLRTEVVVELSVPGAIGVYTAPEGGSASDGGGGAKNRDTLVLVSCTSTPQGRSGHTRVLAFEEDARVAELPEGSDGNPFVCDAATADVCVMAGGTIVQAHDQGLRVTRNRVPVQDVLASEDPELGGLGAEAGVTVVRAAAAGSHACCLLSNRRLHLMALDDGDLMPVLAAAAPAPAAAAAAAAGEEG
ncbi:unnamed protein product, partial [Pylaiella littoralis]